MKLSSIEIKPAYGKQPGEFAYEGKVIMYGDSGMVSVNLSQETVRRVMSVVAVDAVALIRGAELQAQAELHDLREVVADAPNSVGGDLAAVYPPGSWVPANHGVG